MHCARKIKIHTFRSIYLKISNDRFPNRLSTSKTILTDLSPDDKIIWTANLPVENESFQISNTSDVLQPIKVNMYLLYKKYLLSDRKTFDLFDRIACEKKFLYDENEKKILVKIFCFNKNVEGLLWIHRQLVIHDAKQSGSSSDILYFPQAPNFLPLLKEIVDELKNTFNKE